MSWKTAQRKCNVTLGDSQTFCQSQLFMTKSFTGGRIELPPPIAVFFFFLCRPKIKVKYLENCDIASGKYFKNVATQTLINQTLIKLFHLNGLFWD